METFKKTWLSNLKGSVPPEAYGYSVSMYSIALEGWRRGLTLKFINNNQRRSEVDYSLAYKGEERKFCVTKGDEVSSEAVRICKNKNLTKEYLLKAKVPTPNGDVFTKDVSEKEITDYANTLGYPLVIKPSDGTAGSGVIANIKNEIEFKEALSYVRYDLNYTKVIVEKFFSGEDYRLYVVGDRVIGGIKRIPANVVGDGLNTVQYLLDEKNKQRNSTPALHGRLIKIDKELHNVLESEGLTLKSVPKDGQQVFLKTKSNVSAGGDSIDITEELTDEIKTVAIQATNAIPELAQAGVDVIFDRELNTGVVLEINSRPHITAHLYPWEGQARDIPKAIIDYYFPETIGIKQGNSPQFFFDFKSVHDTFQAGTAKEFTIPNVPSGELSTTRFIVSGDIHGVNYEKWVRKQARDLHLNGFIKPLKNGTSSIVVGGPVDSVKKIQNVLNNRSSKRAKVDNVVQKSRKSPIKVGFEIQNSFSKTDKTSRKQNEILPDGYHPVRLRSRKSKKRKTKTSRIKKDMSLENQSIRKERDYYKRKYYEIEKSRSWQVTKPVRKVSDLVRRIIGR